MKYCKKRTKNKVEHGPFIDYCPSCDEEKGIKVSPEQWIRIVKRKKTGKPS